MSNPRLVNRKQIGSAVDKDLYKKLQEYSKSTGIPISRCLDKAIEMFLNSDRKF